MWLIFVHIRFSVAHTDHFYDLSVYEIKVRFYCQSANTLKCQINGGGPNNQGGWKNFRNLINGGVKTNGGVGILETA